MTASTSDIAVNHDGYEEYRASLVKKFSDSTDGGAPLFCTDAQDLFALFLKNLPDANRQHYVCVACRQFFVRYGGLVTIDEQSGAITSPLWDEDTAPEFFAKAVKALRKEVENSAVTGVFISSDTVYGTPVTGAWTHFYAKPNVVYADRLLTAHQAMAAKAEDRRILVESLKEYNEAAVVQAVRVLRTDSVQNSEKFLGIAEWLLDVVKRKNAVSLHKPKAKSALIWLAAAKAPTGFCHVRSTMIGTLLDDIVNGFEFGELVKRFNDKVNPIIYQRPQALPSAGNVAQAEKVIEKLKAEGALVRRYAKLEELTLLWQPAKVADAVANKEGVFAGVRTKGKVTSSRPLQLPKQSMTWVKFKAEVLPTALKLEALTPRTGNYAALVTAVNADAEPIFQWDAVTDRNPVSWYVYPHGSTAEQWCLHPGAYVEVTGVCNQPSMWGTGSFGHLGRSVFFILAGAKDSAYKVSGSALFPVLLKGAYHGIRATIEEYSNSTPLIGYADATACGLRLMAGDTHTVTLRVTTDLGVNEYLVTSWD